MNPRSEPLLWLQLIGLGALPLEALLLLLLLAGSDPGRLPGLERLFTWAIGALLPAVLLFQRPADPFSLLLVMTPVRARRELQRRLAALQLALPLRIGLGLGVAAALPLLIWCDRQAAQAAALSPLDGSPRLVALLLAALLLALMLWQWQQLLQALWFLSRPATALAAATPLGTAEIGEGRLCLGLPLLLPDPLQWASVPERPQTPAAAATPKQQPEPASASPEPAAAQSDLPQSPPQQPAPEPAPAPGSDIAAVPAAEAASAPLSPEATAPETVGGPEPAITSSSDSLSPPITTPGPEPEPVAGPADPGTERPQAGDAGSERPSVEAQPEADHPCELASAPQPAGSTEPEGGAVEIQPEADRPSPPVASIDEDSMEADSIEADSIDAEESDLSPQSPGEVAGPEGTQALAQSPADGSTEPG